MDRGDAEAVIERLHSAQARLCTEGDVAGVREVLSDDIAWHVPGASPIAGHPGGLDEVVWYMLAPRALANGTFRMHRLDVLTRDGSTVAVLTDGSSDRWRGSTLVTVGVYRLEDGRVAECWLLPLDQAELDDIWTPRDPA